jgi:hypothetical protein
MIRSTKYLLLATTMILVCFDGIAWAQQGAATALPSKNESKAQAESSTSSKDGWDDAKFQEAYRRNLDKLLQQLNYLSEKKINYQFLQKELREKIFKQCEMSPENVVPTLLNMEREIMALQIDLEVRRERQKQLAEQIAQVTTNAKNIIEHDRVLEALKELVNARAAESAKAENKERAQAELAEAKIRLEVRKDELVKGNSDFSAEKLNSQMQENSLTLAEDNARLRYLMNHSDYLRSMRSEVDKYTVITETELAYLNRLIDNVNEQLRQEGYNFKQP